jgi:hypothetical protein
MRERRHRSESRAKVRPRGASTLRGLSPGDFLDPRQTANDDPRPTPKSAFLEHGVSMAFIPSSVPASLTFRHNFVIFGNNRNKRKMSE